MFSINESTVDLSDSLGIGGEGRSLSIPTLATTLAAIYLFIQFFQSWQSNNRIKSALDQIPRAKRDSWLFGNPGDRIGDENEGTAFIKAAEELNSNVYLWSIPTGKSILVAGDNIMLNHVLSDVRKFRSPIFRTEFIKNVVGGGIITAGPKDHARHRRIMAPAFTPASIRNLAPIFTSKAQELGEKLLELAKSGGHAEWNEAKDASAPKKSIVNISEIVDAASFDVIGKAGFGVELGCIQKGVRNVGLSSGYNNMLQASVMFGLGRALLFVFAGIFKPSWQALPLNNANRVIRDQNRRLEQLTAQIVDEKVAKAQAEVEADGVEGLLGPSQGAELDLVDMIVRSNIQMASKGAPTLSRDDMRGSIQTLIFAGYETSAVATGMCLYFLAKNPQMQDRIRDEIRGKLDAANEGLSRTDAAYRTQLTADEMQADGWSTTMNCIKETLRVVPAVTMTDREATEDCVLPLGKPIPRRDGKGVITQIAVPKGTEIGVNLKLASADKDIWGEDALEWSPDRWNNLSAAYKASSMPGPAGLPAFSNGPASCLGARFALLEIQSLLIGALQRVLVSPSPYHKIAWKQVLVVRPTVIGKGAAALPLVVEPLPAA